jgi:hypothetical protein
MRRPISAAEAFWFPVKQSRPAQVAGNGCLAGKEAYKKKVLAEYAELEERLKKKVTH